MKQRIKENAMKQWSMSESGNQSRRRSWMVPAILLSAGLVLSGCSASAVPTGETVASQAEAGAVDSDGVPEAPERTAEYNGIVKRIIGNEITLALVEQTDAPEETRTEEEKAARRAERQALSEEERLALKEAQTVMTGEEVLIIIPVGTPITTGGSGTATESGDPVLAASSMADITEGTSLKIWVAEGGGETLLAEYTRVQQPPQP